MAFYVYILRCADGSYYTGHTDDLEKRVAEHHAGEVPGYTRNRRPVELALADEFPTRLEALERERQIKGWSRAKKEALIEGDWERLRQLAKAHGSTGQSQAGDIRIQNLLEGRSSGESQPSLKRWLEARG